ncbi:MAG: DegT/DnrJ/EryC1/StrS family aminotransferase [Deltaproteobacteria bacterium]|nr:DegT/DnrJ/EryC1/StrS family aminotransferase [Deltaproteobacteria bacterium]
MAIPITAPSIEDDDVAAVSAVLRTGMLVQGKNVLAFEARLAELIGVREVVAVSNCTAALQMALLGLGVGVGDLVVVTAYSWLSTANVIELCGAQPVFVDIRPDTFNMDVEALAETLRRVMSNRDCARRVKAILPVHTFGQMAEIDRIISLGAEYGLPVIEDAACALGARLGDRVAGSQGVLGCFSFHPRKAVTTGEGGVITTNDARLADHMRALRNHGQRPGAQPPVFDLAGFNYRMTDFQAALGVTQLAKLDRINAARRAAAARYDRLLAGTGITPPFVAPGAFHVYQSYVTLLPAALAARRVDIMASMKAQGIETAIGTYSMPSTAYFQARYQVSLPQALDIASRSLSLPLFEALTAAEQAAVIATLCEAAAR